jgi:magnesium-dependent phosphatase 1
MGKKIKLYPDTIDILQELHQKGHTLSVASRTTAPAIAQELLKHFAIDQYFKHSQIYPGSKTIHFQNLRNLTGREFSSMLFFDDELRNIAEVSAMGVKSILVEKGITKALVNKSLILN